MKTVITHRLSFKPIEDHPSFSSPDVRFRHARIRKRFKKLKEMGIETYVVPEMITKSYP